MHVGTSWNLKRDWELLITEYTRYINRDRGESHGSAPPTPPDMRVRIRRFGELSHERTASLGIPSESK